jgi:hypothetical protein
MQPRTSRVLLVAYPPQIFIYFRIFPYSLFKYKKHFRFTALTDKVFNKSNSNFFNLKISTTPWKMEMIDQLSFSNY